MSTDKRVSLDVMTERTSEAVSITSTLSGRRMDDDIEHQATTTKELQLSPMPSDDPDDPLNWPLWLKIAILTQTSLLAAIGGLNTATINPAMLQLAREFGVDRVRASYQTTVCIALNGIAPWLWIPLAYKYGRRPVYLGTTLLGFVSILGCAYTKTYTQMLIARIFNGLFPVGFALGATTVTDLFFFHQRGRAMGFFTVTVVNGAHMAPIIGGLLGQYSGWRWIFKFLAIVDAVLFIVAFFCLPETMYNRRTTTNTKQTFITKLAPAETAIENESGSEDRSDPSLTAVQAIPSHISTTTLDIDRPGLIQPRSKIQTYLWYLRLYSVNTNYEISYVKMIMPTLRLFLSPTAVFPAIYYASMYGFASILPAVTVAAIFTEFFHWNTLHIGLSFGAALTIGGILGEFFAGWVCDAVVKREQARLQQKSPIQYHQSSQDHNRDQSQDGGTETKIRPEVRLRPIWPGAILTPVGLLVYGFTLQYRTHPALPLFGMALSCFGLQIITTCTYTYAIDCHTSSSSTPSTSTTSLQQQQRQRERNQPQEPASEQEEEEEEEAPRGKQEKVEPAGAAQVAQLFNFIRQMFGFTFAFYVVHMGEKIGYQWTFTIFAFCGGVLAFSPVVWLILRANRRRP